MGRFGDHFRSLGPLGRILEAVAAMLVVALLGVVGTWLVDRATAESVLESYLKAEPTVHRSPSTDAEFQSWTAATTFEGSLVAVGYQDDGADGEEAAGIWVLNDRGDMVLTSTGLFDGSGSVSAWGVAEHEGVLVAVGRERVRTAGVDSPADGAAWRSEGGARWSRLAEQAIDGASGSGEEFIRAVAWSNVLRAFVAVGWLGDSSSASCAAQSSSCTAAIWRSTTGEQWSLVSTANSAGGQFARTIVEADGQLMVGGGAGGSATVWIVGRQGELETVRLSDKPSSVHSIIAVGETLLAGGVEENSRGSEAVIWISSDRGAHWSIAFASAGLGNQQIASMSLVDGLVWAVGRDDGGSVDSDGAVWVGESADQLQRLTLKSFDSLDFNVVLPHPLGGVAILGRADINGAEDGSEAVLVRLARD